MTILDSVIIPVIFTDKNGRIEYKNQAAKRCIPSPRAGGNLHKYIAGKNTDMPLEDVGVLYIENQSSIFKSAFVMHRDDRYIWLFPAELQLSDPEDIAEIPKSSLRAFGDSVSRLILDCSDNTAEPSPLRYHRMEEELLKALRQINLEKSITPFSVSDILTSLSKETVRLSAALNFRIKFNFDIRDSRLGYRIKFVPFAMIYTYILTFMLRSSKKCECYIDAMRIEDIIKFTFSTTIDKTGIAMPDCTDFSQLASLFPRDRINLMLTTQRTAKNGFGINWALSSSGDLMLNLTVPLKNTDEMFLLQPQLPAVIQREFRRQNKRVLEYIESVFMQWSSDLTDNQD